VRIGITTILSGPIADRGQSEQYGAELALDAINQSGGLLGRPVEAFYADNACKPDIGVPATRRLLEQEHVPVIIGALCTPVTHAIMPLIQEAKIPLVIATSAGQDFVDASGAGGNDYAFKTIPSEVDIARGLIHYLASSGLKSVAIVTETGRFAEANAVAFANAAKATGMTVTAQELMPPDLTDFKPLLDKLKAGDPGVLLAMPGSVTAGFFKAYAASGWKVPVSGRLDVGAAMAAVSPDFVHAGGLDSLTSAAVYSPFVDQPGVRDFVALYRAHYGLMPTQRPFFVYEAVFLVADAIRRAGSDSPAAIEAALKTTKMPSLLGGTYAMDDHNHPHTPIFIIGMKDNKPSVIATE
jgi:branched-chain amino acid transport system substrate-binding protein